MQILSEQMLEARNDMIRTWLHDYILKNEKACADEQEHWTLIMMSE